MVDICSVMTAVKLTFTKMDGLLGRCRCCFSPETLVTLQRPILEILRLIYTPQDVKINDYPTEVCYTCQNFLRKVEYFMNTCREVDEIFRNRLQSVKHETEVIIKNEIDDDSSDVRIKTEITEEYDEFDQIDVQINKVEVESDPEDVYRSYTGENSLTELDVQMDCRPDAVVKLEPIADQSNVSVKVLKRPRKKYKKDMVPGKPFKCNECSYECNKRINMLRHRSKHTGERPISCELCDYTCVAKYNLTRHMSLKHSEERPYACDQCDYRAKIKNSLFMHKKQHSTVYDFQCEFCPYGCFRRIKLKNHMKSKHRLERSP